MFIPGRRQLIQSTETGLEVFHFPRKILVRRHGMQLSPSVWLSADSHFIDLPMNETRSLQWRIQVRPIKLCPKGGSIVIKDHLSPLFTYDHAFPSKLAIL